MTSAEGTKNAGYREWLNRRPAMLLALARVLAWFKRSRDRDRLAALDDRFLRDMGLSRYDVEHETRKWFWQP